ncbi:IS66 family transposase [Methanospirillum stamsii]|uniref:IS66 family transposase n=1 Tax=Methanospirillum stamsii TaxID=1277351 RepID=A0A2V2MV58_9EURY|nr:IS66 family transposase [Methanospirillum stamsii]PWR70095.1 IS66 family transposase [Methanospirillum stamsii]
MMNKKRSENIEKDVKELEHTIAQLKKELDKERKKRELVQRQKSELLKENKKLKKQIAQILSSAPFLAASCKTAEAGGVPSSKIFYRRKRQSEENKKKGGQPGHIGHGRERPVSNSPTIDVTLDTCPDCGTHLHEPVKGAEQRRTITDIPFPSHIVYEIQYQRYWCPNCKKFVRGEFPLPPNQQFGPAVASWIVYQRMLGLTIRKIQSSLLETYEIHMSEATILKLERWVADTLKEDYEKLKEEIIHGNNVNADETGFRIDGDNGWLWVFTSTIGSFYKVAPTRGHTVPDEVLKDFKGVLGRDAWKPYDVVECSGHQLDLLHVNRWLERAEIKHKIEPRSLLTSQPAILLRKGRPPEKFLEFVNGIREILKRAVEYTENDPPPSINDRKNAYAEFQAEIMALLDREWVDKDVIRIAKELRKREKMLLTFMLYDDVPWHNNDAERAIRQGVLHRKISGGRRTWVGADVFGVLLSIYETSKKRKERFIGIVGEKLGFSSFIEIPNNSSS